MPKQIAPRGVLTVADEVLYILRLKLLQKLKERPERSKDLRESGQHPYTAFSRNKQGFIWSKAFASIRQGLAAYRE